MGGILNASVILPCILLVVLRCPAIAISRTSAEQDKPGIFTHSGCELRELAQKDFALAERLKAFLTENQDTASSTKVLEIANEYLQEFGNSTTSASRSNARAHGERCAENPLLRFKLLRRVAYLFRILRNRNPGDIQELQRLTRNEFENIGPGIMKDLMEAMDAILQIHFTYNLKARDLAAGKLGEMRTEANLLASHCFHIGVRAKVEGQYALAIEWLKEAIRLAKIDGTTDVPTVRAELFSTIRDHNFRWDNGGLYDIHLYARPLRSSEVNEEEIQNIRARELLEAKHAGGGRNCSYWHVNTLGLCSGRNFHMPHDTLHLFCWREFKAHKALTVGPLKMEFLSRNPDVVQIYDAFSGETVSAHTAHGNYSLPNMEAVISSGFSSGASAEAKGGEQFKMSEYLAGAPSDIEVDALPEGTTNHRDVTLILNLNNVDAGGYTVFPAAFVTSVPTQGSAIFWFNTLSDGSADFLTAYAHCPVILGHKAVAHKWLSFSNGKCLLQPKDRFQVPVNGKAMPTPSAVYHNFITKEEYDNPKPFIAIDVATRREYWRKDILKYAYGSMRSIRSLIQLDWEIYASIKRMATGKTALDQSWELIEQYFQDFNETAYKSISLMANETERNEAVSKLALNPLAIFRTMWRFENYVKKWTSRKDQLPRSAHVHKTDPSGQTFRFKIRLFLPALMDYIETVYNATEGPTYRDLEYSIIGILIMQETYDFKSKDIAQGIVAGMDMGTQLTAAECLEFGRVAIMHGFFHIAVQWMETSVTKIVSEKGPVTELAAAQEELETAEKAHDMSLQRTKGWDPNTYTQPVSSVNYAGNSRLQTNKEVHYIKYKFSIDPEYAVINYFGVCQGKQHQTVEEQRKLFCWYESQVDPYWKIRPLKAELLSMYPKAEVVQFHDILSKQLIHYLLNHTDKQNEFLLSKLADELNPIDRLGATSWRYTNISQEALRIMRIVKKASGLRLTAGDVRSRLQIGTYAPGSHYKAHPDTVSFGEDDDVGRIATFMFYLNDVEKGGATVFAQAGVHVPPEAGSAIFWYNMLSTGVMDDYTYHGACPVIYGEKHVATQWLRYVDQDHLKCHADQGKRMEILVNGKSKYNF